MGRLIGEGTCETPGCSLPWLHKQPCNTIPVGPGIPLERSEISITRPIAEGSLVILRGLGHDNSIVDDLITAIGVMAGHTRFIVVELPAEAGAAVVTLADAIQMLERAVAKASE